MWKLVKSFLPGGLSVYTVVGVGLLALAGGIWLGNTIQSVQTARVQGEFDQYKIADLKDANSASARTVSELQRLNKILGRIEANQSVAQKTNDTFSENLIKELYRANDGTSCPLSPGLERYLDGLRNSTSAPGVN